MPSIQSGESLQLVFNSSVVVCETGLELKVHARRSGEIEEDRAVHRIVMCALSSTMVSARKVSRAAFSAEWC